MTMLLSGQIAPVSRRAVAYLIDALIAGGLAIVLVIALSVTATLSGGVEAMLGILLIGGPLVGLVLLGWFVVYTVMQTGRGSIGMRAQGLRLVSDTDGASLGFGRALLRNIIFGLSAAIVVGYFTPLFDGSGRFQGWHDKVAKSLMVDARAEGETSPVETAASGSVPAHGPLGSAQRPAIPGLPQAAPASFAPPPVPPLPTAGSYAAQPPAPYAASAPHPSAPSNDAPQPDAGAPQQQPAAPAPVPVSDGLIAFVPGVTQDAPPARVQPPVAAPAEPADAVAAPAAPVTVVAPAAAPAPAPTPAPVDDLEETRISIPGHRLVFTWDDGTRVPVSRRTIFGRNPGAEDGAVLVPVRDETLSLSKTHFEAAAETSGGWVLDRHSTNGTTIVRDGQRIACPPGQRVPVRLGDAIEIGDRIVTIGGYA
jgi:uncharacterized RDD family membrane protein YckC